VTDGTVQAAHLVVPTFTDGDEAPLTRVHVATTYIFWKVVVTAHPSGLNGMRPAIREPDSCA
jgi:hypothetical protein